MRWQKPGGGSVNGGGDRAAAKIEGLGQIRRQPIGPIGGIARRIPAECDGRLSGFGKVFQRAETDLSATAQNEDRVTVGHGS